MDGPMGKGADEVEVSNDRPGFWARWQVGFLAPETDGEEDEGKGC